MRISLSNTKVTKYSNSNGIQKSSLVKDRRFSGKQIVYFILVLGLFVIGIAVSTFVINNNSNTPIRNDSKDSNSVDNNSKHWFTATDVCLNSDYTKWALKLQYSASFGGSFMALKGTKKYEASGIRYDNVNDRYYVVFDSLFGLGSLVSTLDRSYDNILVPDSQGNITGDSDYEGIAIDRETEEIYLLTEAIKYKLNNNNNNNDLDDKVYQAVISHANMTTIDGESQYYSVKKSCYVEYNFTHENKGFEGLSLLQLDNRTTRYFLGLCEGNYCEGGNKGRTTGHGRILVIKYKSDINKKDDPTRKYDCSHQVLTTIKLPKSIDFTDYSALSFRKIDGSPNYYRVIIASQEDSAVWIGYFDLEKFEFSEHGDIYVFPKIADCKTVFCNVEGVEWIDDHTFIAVSDRMKSGKQPYECRAEDQSIHIFTIP
jgi:hypothetical protein